MTAPAISGQTLTIAATGGGTATSITFGTGAGQVSTLNELNAALAANNLQATIDTTGKITITTTNDAASSTIGAIGGTAAASGQAFNGLTAAAPVADPNSQATRASLVAQYNNILHADQHHGAGRVVQRRQPAERRHAEADVQRNRQVDAEHHRRHLQPRRPRSFDPDLGHRLPGQQLGQQGVDRAERRQHHAALGSIDAGFEPVDRADPSGLLKNLINVLQTGSSNLTLADTNEEAANSQALSTRQSIAVSALSLANQSQQSVLQLLR